MKIWWPWRRNKSTPSLFEGSVPVVGQSADLQQEKPKKRLLRQPHPMNAPGDFYAENTECITCGYPHVLAPDLMAWERDAEGRESHCYFKKQPETPLEVEQAINAVNGSCCGALCYAGSDREILKRIS
ncbi:MAG TPA: hypothetical protein VHA06_07515 [Candidatus Angelobacter sp.]|nr:hypothetical protein [Candidatus Angelobacter sp.]